MRKDIGHLCPRYRTSLSEIWDIFGRDIGHKSPRPYCPAVIGFAASLVEVIGFAASLVEEIKEIKEIFTPSAKPFLLFLRDDYYLMRKVFIVPIFIVPQK